MKTLKAGCVLLNKDTKCIALIYREKQKDFSFPKGHVEQNEDIMQAAIRETAEETKRIAKILECYEPFVDCYKTPSGEDCECYMYIAVDHGISDNKSEDVHELIWIPFDLVEEKLSYQGLKNMWNQLKEKIANVLDNK